MKTTDPWKVLGLPEGASDEEIRARYVALVKRHPPHLEAATFAAIRDAHIAINTPRKRAYLALFGPEPLAGPNELIELAKGRERRPLDAEDWIEALRKARRQDEAP